MCGSSGDSLVSFMLFMGGCNCEVHPILIVLSLKVAKVTMFVS